MNEPLEILNVLTQASPVVLALIVALAVVGLAAFAIWVVHNAHGKRDSQ